MTTRCERFQALALAVVLAIGAALPWVMAIGLSYTIVENIFFPSDTVTEDLHVMDDDTLVKGVYSRVGGWIYRKLDGTLIEGSPEFWETANLQGPVDQNKSPKRLSWNERILEISRPTGNVWYLVNDGELNGRAYFVGYDATTKFKIGCIGRSGFSVDKPNHDDQFPVNGYTMTRTRVMQYMLSMSDVSQCHLVTDDGLVRIDLRNRTASLLRKATDLISACVFETFTRELGNVPRLILLRTPDKILVLTPDGKRNGVYPIPQKLRGRDIRFALDRNHPTDHPRTALAYAGSNVKECYWIDGKTKTIRTQRLDIGQKEPRSVVRKVFNDRVMPSIVLPSPGVFAAVLGWWYFFEDGFGNLWKDLRVVIPITSVISAVLAILCYRRQRKYGLSWTWMWTGFVLLFGLPAYFGYLVHRQWPARLACPNCKKLAPRDRPACMACGRDFPRPAMNGAEVFWTADVSPG